MDQWFFEMNTSVIYDEETEDEICLARANQSDMPAGRNVLLLALTRDRTKPTAALVADGFRAVTQADRVTLVPKTAQNHNSVGSCLNQFVSKLNAASPHYKFASGS